ncbi:YaiI/YqxD family protein [Bdellovibrio bacteriovorus]
MIMVMENKNEIQIFIDADGCPVKEETYKVAARYKIKTYVVANKYLNVPLDPLIEMKVVAGTFDAADDWIAETVTHRDIVVTADILLAERCVKKRARVLGPKGIEFTEDNIGSAVANRELMQNLRHMGEMRGGPAPMDQKARSQFLGKLDQIIQAQKRV